MSAHHRTLLCVGMLLMSAGGVLVFIVSPLQTVLFLLGIFLGVVGMALFITGLCLAMKNLQVAVPGHFLLHPRTGTRFNPQQAQAIQRYTELHAGQLSCCAEAVASECFRQRACEHVHPLQLQH